MIEVILMERIERLGTMGQVVKVKPGFARNFLLPQRKALRATPANRAYFEQQRATLEAQNAQQRAAAAKTAESLQGVNLLIVRQASEAGQLYGSVAARDVATAAAEAGYTIERHQIDIGTPIKVTGLFTIKVRLHPEVVASITLSVARTEEEGQLQLTRGVAAPDAGAERSSPVNTDTADNNAA